jgi:NAD(P)-dependent dehydrogenase (short-subunit alcohol dehydrogenase family)
VSGEGAHGSSEVLGSALVTGAARGIGLAISTALAAAGFSVHAVDRDGAALEEARREIGAGGGRCETYVCDVVDPEQVERMVGRVADGAGRIDLLVNNAGTYHVDDLLDLSFETWRRVLSVNADGTFLVGQATARRMVDQPIHAGLGRRGMVINIGSVASQGGRPNRSAYGASKALVRHLTMSQALAWREHDVAACLVCPGEVLEGMLRNIYDGLGRVSGVAADELIESARLALPRQRFQTTDEVAQRIVFLATSTGMRHTGSVLWCDSRIEPL